MTLGSNLELVVYIARYTNRSCALNEPPSVASGLIFFVLKQYIL